MHHGVRINDEALVDAAVESDRYIADRFLPDKCVPLSLKACLCICVLLGIIFISNPLNNHIQQKRGSKYFCKSLQSKYISGLNAQWVLHS